jgi:hypothetical protein
MIQPAAPKKYRLGCVAQFWLTICALCVLFLAFEAVFMPWGFYLGGHFHIIPEWSGMGTAHAANGRDYIIFVSISPNARHPGRYDTALQGTGLLCTPKGEKIRLTLSASMDKHLGVNTQDKTIRISMHQAGTWSAVVNSDRRPSFSLEGTWGNDEISVADRNSLGRAFEPDGSVYMGHSPTRGPSFPPVQFMLHAASSRDFDKACASQMWSVPSKGAIAAQVETA